MTDKKMTKIEKLEIIKAMLDPAKAKADFSIDDVNAFIDKEIESIAKHNARKSTKKTPTQLENERLKAEIIDFMKEVKENVTIPLLMNSIEGFSSPQKCSSLLTQLKKENLIARAEGKKAEFYLI